MMKKIILIATVLMSSVFSVNAQSRFEAGSFTLQPRLGGTASMMTNAPKIDFEKGYLSKNSLDPEPTPGSIFGLDLEYMVTNRLGVAAGINFSQQGSGWENYNVTENGIKTEVRELKIETEYINVPITVNYYVLKGLALKAGVQFGFLTDAKVKASVKQENLTNKPELDIKDAFKKFDVSIPVGLSYEFKTPITLDLRYNIGLTKVNKEALETNKDTKNGVLTLTVGYKFKL